MAYQLNWHLERRIIKLMLVDDVYTTDFEDINMDLQRMHVQGIAPIHMIVDNQSLDKLNTDLRSLREAMPVLNDRDFGMVCVVGTQTMSRMFADLVAGSYRLDVRVSDSIRDAEDLLIQGDDSLNNY